MDSNSFGNKYSDAMLSHKRFMTYRHRNEIVKSEQPITAGADFRT